VRIAGRCFAFAALLALGASLACAQSAVDIGMSFGAAFDKSNGAGIDNASSANAYGPCTPNSGDIYCETTGSMNGFFLGFGGDIMLYKHFGVGAEFNVQPSQHSYGPLTDRQMFYDFNGVYEPYSTKRMALMVQGGVGGARTSFNISESGCVGNNIACSTQVEPVGTDSHFQVHIGVGLQVRLSHHLFIRPQFDFHYVPGLNNDFNSNAVPEATVVVGFASGGD
jgi:hypothetical protein